jgi:hypothetical protein
MYSLARAKGVILVEFAIILPVLLIIVFGFSQVQWYFVQRKQVEQGVWSALSYARRLSWPLTASQTDRVKQLVKTGSFDASAPPLTTLWGSWLSDSDISISSLSFPSAAGGTVAGVQVAVAFSLTNVLSLGYVYTLEVSHASPFIS